MDADRNSKISTPIIMIWTNKNSPIVGGGETSNEGLELTEEEKKTKKKKTMRKMKKLIKIFKLLQ